MGKVADLSVFTPGGQPGAPNPSEGLAALRQNQTAFMETIGVMPPESLTIVDGAISPTTAVCIVDAEGGAPADDLTTINVTLSDGSTLHDGMLILLSAKDASRVVTVKNSDAPNGVKTTDGKDVVLSTEWVLVLQYFDGTWAQMQLAAPLKPATETTLGGVKVGDGLTALDGILSADLATAEKAGRVKASETAQAGAVPLSGNSGLIDVSWLKNAILPVGSLVASLAESIDGWLLCHGALLSRVTYAELFGIIGTSFGKGDGSTTFALPDFRDKTLWGANGNLMKIISAGAPNINGFIGNLVSTSIESGANRNGSFEWKRREGVGIVNVSPGQGFRYDPTFDASWSSTVYGNSKTIQPPAIAVNIFIKY